MTFLQVTVQKHACRTDAVAERTQYGYARVNWYAFKPLVISEVLENRCGDGDLLVYHDVDVCKYTEYGRTQWSHVSDMMTRFLDELGADVFAPVQSPENPKGATVKKFVKAHILRHVLGGELAHDDPAFDHTLLRANRFAAKRSEASIDFVRRWVDLCRREDLVAPVPNPDPHPDFCWSNGDQDALNALVLECKRAGTLHPEFPRYGFAGNVLTEQNTKRCPRRHLRSRASPHDSEPEPESEVPHEETRADGVYRIVPRAFFALATGIARRQAGFLLHSRHHR